MEAYFTTIDQMEERLWDNDICPVVRDKKI